MACSIDLIDTAIRSAQDMRHKSQLFFHGLQTIRSRSPHVYLRS